MLNVELTLGSLIEKTQDNTNSKKNIKDNTDTSSVTKENAGSRDTEDNVKSTVDT